MTEIGLTKCYELACYRVQIRGTVNRDTKFILPLLFFTATCMTSHTHLHSLWEPKVTIDMFCSPRFFRHSSLLNWSVMYDLWLPESKMIRTRLVYSVLLLELSARELLNGGVARLRLFGDSLEATFWCCSLNLSSLGFGSDVCYADVKLFWHILAWCWPWQLEHELVDLHFRIIWPLLRHTKHFSEGEKMEFSCYPVCGSLGIRKAI